MELKFTQKGLLSRDRWKRLNNFVIYGLAIFITLIAYVYFEFQGYPQVITATETLTITTPAIYMIPVFFPLGMLLGEIIYNWIEGRIFEEFLVNLGGILLIIIFSGIRLVLKTPFSGHSLILSFFLLHELISNKRNYMIRIIIGLSIFLITMFYKIIIWNDPITLISGLILGSLIWIINESLRKRIEN